ncbi:membralin [Brevipalpus obovatus]|uniref:membralin n=1 Tax=Brevipalpus obovatus TaxID=246614 RepID=UPI003D9DD80D
MNTIINNNNSDGPHGLLEVRDDIHRRGFKRLAFKYATKVPSRVRSILEFGVLLLALLSLLTLSYLHVVFIQRPINCLESVEDSWFRDGILRVEIIDSMQQTVMNHAQDAVKDMETSEYKEEGESDENKILLISSSLVNDVATLTNVSIDNLVESLESSNSDGYQSFLDENLSHLQMLARIVWPQEQHVVEYSLEYGFLRLTPKTRQKLNIPIKTISLDPNRDKCFGDRFGRFLLKNLLGYDVILMGSLQTLAERQNNKGYFRNVVTGEHYRFVNIWMTRSAYFVALFIMLVLTLFNSMLLRYAHHLVFVFVAEIMQMLEFNINFTFPFAPLSMVILALVAMQAVMSEFFNDTTTAFNVMLIVWAADQYDAFCCHTMITRRHWPKFFYLYHFLFYAYDYRFYGHYSSLALLTSWLFIQHSMIYFFHRYEIPSVLSEMARNSQSTIFTNPSANPSHLNGFAQSSVTSADSNSQVTSSSVNDNDTTRSQTGSQINSASENRRSRTPEEDWEHLLSSEGHVNNSNVLRISHQVSNSTNSTNCVSR